MVLHYLKGPCLKTLLRGSERWTKKETEKNKDTKIKEERKRRRKKEIK